MQTLSEIKDEVDRLAQKIGAPDYLLPTYGKTDDIGRAHIEVDAFNYHYIVVERGEELRRITAKDLDEILYQVFASITFDLATDMELSGRKLGDDIRSEIWKHQVEMLGRLSSVWRARLEQEIKTYK